jgi:hypothetical protein
LNIIRQALQNKDIPKALKKSISEYHIDDDGIIMFQGRMVVPDKANLKREIVQSHHGSVTAGHPRREKTLDLVTRDYWWTSVMQYVHKYVDGCEQCKCSKTVNTPSKVPLKPLKVPEGPWQDITYNLIMGLLKSKGFDSILMLRCVNLALLVNYRLGSSMVEYPYMRLEVLGSNPSLAIFSCFTLKCGGLFLKNGTLHTVQREYHSPRGSRTIPTECLETTWIPSRFRPRTTVQHCIPQELIQVLGNQAPFLNSVPSSNRWTNGATQSEHRAISKALCNAVPRQLGRIIALSGVHI